VYQPGCLLLHIEGPLGARPTGASMARCEFRFIVTNTELAKGISRRWDRRWRRPATPPWRTSSSQASVAVTQRHLGCISSQVTAGIRVVHQ
jgi:hypothetical protein